MKPKIAASIRKPIRCRLHVRVYTSGERFENLPTLRVITPELFVSPRTTVPHETSHLIVSHIVGSKDFREPSLTGTSIHIHLPESVLSLNKTLGEKEVV